MSFEVPMARWFLSNEITDKVNRGKGEDRDGETTVAEERRKPKREFEVGLCVPGSPFSLGIYYNGY